jgi:hypothetical protein
VRAQSELDHNSAPIGAPATALTPVDCGAQVAVLADGGKVVLSRSNSVAVLVVAFEVTAGLAPEDQVIDSPPETLQSGDAVRLAFAASSTPPPAVAGPRSRPLHQKTAETAGASRLMQPLQAGA